jgi:hypothetical protein
MALSALHGEVGAETAIRPLLQEQTPLILKDGRIANVSVSVVPFDDRSDTLNGAIRRELAQEVAEIATDCFLTAQAIGHVQPGENGEGDTLTAHRLARARSDKVVEMLTSSGVPQASIASVWDWQFIVREPRVTLWIFSLMEGEDCEGKPLGGPAVASINTLDDDAPSAAGQSMSPAGTELSDRDLPPPRETAATTTDLDRMSGQADLERAAEGDDVAEDNSVAENNSVAEEQLAEASSATSDPTVDETATATSDDVEPLERLSAAEIEPIEPPVAETAAVEQPEPIVVASPKEPAAVPEHPEAIDKPRELDFSAMETESLEMAVTRAEPAAAPQEEIPEDLVGEIAGDEVDGITPPPSEPSTIETASIESETESIDLTPVIANQSNSQELEIIFAINSSYLPRGASGQIREMVRNLEDRPYRAEIIATVGAGDVDGASPEEALKYNRWMAERRIGRVQEQIERVIDGQGIPINEEYIDNDPSRKVVIRLQPLP